MPYVRCHRGDEDEKDNLWDSQNKCIGNRRCIGITNLNCDNDRLFNCWDAIYENTAINSDDSEKNCFLEKNERFGK